MDAINIAVDCAMAFLGAIVFYGLGRIEGESRGRAAMQEAMFRATRKGISLAGRVASLERRYEGDGCKHCGGDAEAVETANGWHVEHTCECLVDDAGEPLFMRTKAFETEAEAVEAWKKGV